MKYLKELLRNKAVVHDGFDSNVVIKVYDEISYKLIKIFHSSFNKGIFPEQLKVEKKLSNF